MLNILRKEKIRKGVFWFIAVAVIATFVVSGIIVTKGDKDTSAALAQLDKRNISVRDYLDSYRAVQHQIDLFYGGQNIDRSRINIKGEAWDRLLLLDHAKKQNIRVSDKEIVDWITTQPAFKNKDKFDTNFYKMYIERGLRSTPRQFEEEIRQMLIIRKVNDKLREGLNLTDDTIKDLYMEQKTERDILMATLPKSAFTSQVTTTDKDIEQLFELMKDKLTAPEKIKLKYIFVPKDKADSLKQALQDSASSVDDLSKKFGLEIKETAFFERNKPVDEFKTAAAVINTAFASEVGANTAWQATDGGSYRIQVAEKQPEHLMTLEEGRDELKRIFSEQKAVELGIKKFSDLKAKMTNPDDFEKILKEEKIETTPVEKYKKGMYPSGIWPSDNLEKNALKLKLGEISAPFEVPSGAMMVKVTKLHGFDEKKFAEEKDKFKEDVSDQKGREEMEKLLEKLRDKLSLNLELLKDIFPADSASEK